VKLKSIGLLLVLVSLYSCNIEEDSSLNNDNQTDIALKTFEDTITSDLEIDTLSIAEIDYGRKSIRLSHKINTTSNEVYPILSKDGQKLFFSGMDRTGFFDFKQDFIKSKNCGGEDIYVSNLLNDGVWSDARPITYLNTNGHECVTHVLEDGSLLLTASYEENIGFSNGKPGVETSDLFLAEKKRSDEYSIFHFDEPVNSMWTEADGFMKNDEFILFVSDRPGNIGEYHKKGWSWNNSMWGNTDVWVSLYSEYNWQDPINLGDMVNTSGAERTPWLSADGLTLYLSSNGYDSSNDLDIYTFTRKDPNDWINWSGPIKIKDACSDLDDWGYKLDFKDEAYFSRALPLNFKSSQITRGGDGGIRETNFRTGYDVHGIQVGSYLKENQTDIFHVINEGKPVRTFEDVAFDFNKSSLKKSSESNLFDLVDLIKQNNPKSIVIEGHTDNVGGEQYNLELSLKRANSVKSFLLENKITGEINTIGHGESKPLFKNNSSRNKAANRRVEIYFKALSNLTNLTNSSKIDTIKICSFNIQFLGHFKARENQTLSEILKPYDVVVVQEMVAPPVSGVYPSNKQSYKADIESKAFVDAMENQGFSYWMSTEDTGPTKNHVNSTASEWWITFYRKNVIVPDSSRFYGFLDNTLAGSSKFERVPFCMPFKSLDDRSTFSLISLHLKPGNGPAARERRSNEIKVLFDWIESQPELNKDFIVLGDCNIYKKEEFEKYESKGVFSLNKKCYSTNTKHYEDSEKGKPYDHVFYNTFSENEIIKSSFVVVDIMKIIRQLNTYEIFPYEPYEHDLFRTHFSDHAPVSFYYVLGKDND
jgi:outer membrane protein OmpA-like peptidoglycan-associated protein